MHVERSTEYWRERAEKTEDAIAHYLAAIAAVTNVLGRDLAALQAPPRSIEPGDGVRISEGTEYAGRLARVMFITVSDEGAHYGLAAQVDEPDDTGHRWRRGLYHRHEFEDLGWKWPGGIDSHADPSTRVVDATGAPEVAPPPEPALVEPQIAVLQRPEPAPPAGVQVKPTAAAAS